jgi:gentisate 1,2-dioxygenase
VECAIRHYKARLKNATRGYLVIEGKGVFIINEERHDALPYDLFLILDGDTYEYEGKMKLFEFNVPATDSSNEEKFR